MSACRGCHSAVTLCPVWGCETLLNCDFKHWLQVVKHRPVFPIIQKTLVWAIFPSSDSSGGAGGWLVAGTLEAWHQMSPGHPWSLAMVRVRGSNSVTGLIMPSQCQVNRGDLPQILHFIQSIWALTISYIRDTRVGKYLNFFHVLVSGFVILWNIFSHESVERRIVNCVCLPALAGTRISGIVFFMEEMSSHITNEPQHWEGRGHCIPA